MDRTRQRTRQAAAGPRARDRQPQGRGEDQPARENERHPSPENGRPVDAPFAEGLSHAHTPLCGNRERIVVGVDRLPDAVAALRWAAQEARLRATHLHVVHAWEPPERKEQAQQVVAEMLAEAFARLPVEAESLTIRGHAAEALVAAGHGAALIVVGSHARGTFAEVFTSVTRRTAALSACPVAAVRAGQDVPPRFGVVAVGVDDSFTSRDALRWAAGEAAHRGALLRVVPALSPPSPGRRALPWRTAREAGEMAGYLLGETLTGPLARVRVSVEPAALATGTGAGAAAGLPGPGARSALIDVSRRADVIVVGAHGYGLFSGGVAGSVTSDCLHGAACPVVVIPQAREDQRERVRDAMLAMEAGASILYPEGSSPGTSAERRSRGSRDAVRFRSGVPSRPAGP